jgi:hypothetical protein
MLKTKKHAFPHPFAKYLIGIKKDPPYLSKNILREHGGSYMIATLLILALVVLVALLVLLMMPQMPFLYDPTIPAIFKIITINHDDHGVRTLASYMVVINTGEVGFRNRNLEAETYRNGVRLDCRIPTFHGGDYVSTHHFKIEKMGGPGTCKDMWDPNEMVFIDYADKTFRPGDIVTFEVYDKLSGQIISRHTYKA